MSCNCNGGSPVAGISTLDDLDRVQMLRRLPSSTRTGARTSSGGTSSSSGSENSPPVALRDVSINFDTLAQVVAPSSLQLAFQTFARAIGGNP